VGLGSNLGDREANMKRAVEMLGRRKGIDVVQVSSFLETDPVGGPPGQPKFLNGAAALDTALSPRGLLERCMEVERELGRARGPDHPRWGARPIDIDILLYGDRVVREPDLVVPHPRMHEREFVLAPLAEIAPGARHRFLKKTVGQLLVMAKERSSSPTDALELMRSCAVDIEAIDVPADLIAAIPAEMVRKHRFLPIGRGQGTLAVAVVDPSDIYALDEIRLDLKENLTMYAAAPDALDRAIEKYYGPPSPASAERS
jgi:2-amino-4-hydroxy-6-hydroxymethyldihydropteridine diphosphokinase